MSEQRYDVVSVDIESYEVWLVATDLSEADAKDAMYKALGDSIGYDEVFYELVTAGSYAVGSRWRGKR